MGANKDNLTFVEHLTELRKRLIYIIIVLGLAVIAGFFVAQPVITYLKSVPPAADMEWNVFSPWDAVRIYVNVSVLFAVIVTLPFTLYQIWEFVKPGLKKEEQKASLLYIPGAFLLSLVGLAFGYFVVFPLAFLFATTIANNLHLTETYGVSQYFSFMFNIVLPITLLFEMPLVAMFLTRIGIINPQVLGKFRRYAYFFLFVLSAVITPPDLLTAVLVCLPMLVLYEISLFLSRIVYNRLLARAESAENAP
jgi:sec-independent protein translocase protein TatC